VGDPITRDFFITLAAHTGLPELVEALKGFALGQRGPFASRAKTVQMLGEKGFLPPGPVRVWHQGEWDEISVLTFEISGEATTVHTPGVMRLVDEARAAMNKGEFPRSEQLWRQALQLEPDKPDLLNNLATAVRQQDRVDEANALLDDLLRRHPDYLFGRVNSAHRYIEEGKFAEAHEVLKPLFRRRKLHTTEFFGLAGAWISLLISEGTPAAAQPWLSMWKQIAPDHPQLRFWQQQLSICRRRQLQH
jgi:tetratricopeptide (TPR) repeat protein